MDLLAAEDESEPLMNAIAEVWSECEGLSHAAFALAFLKYASASAVMRGAAPPARAGNLGEGLGARASGRGRESQQPGGTLSSPRQVR